MSCLACGFENPAGLKFCGNCAQPIKPEALPCPSCGFENPLGFKFWWRMRDTTWYQDRGQGRLRELRTAVDGARAVAWLAVAERLEAGLDSGTAQPKTT